MITLKGITPVLKGLELVRIYKYIEYLSLVILLWMVVSQLIVLLSIDVWRQDSMYYVSSYKDKVVTEGRWINFIFFHVLKHIPASICILTSYFCLGYFTYSIFEKLEKNWRYSASIALLVLCIPVLTIQFEWPETLLVAYLLLPAAIYSSKRLSIYLFFPLFACLFMGTYSAFYFLTPLLFLTDLNIRSSVRLLMIWGVSFCIGYAVTNGIVWLASGNVIQISNWRDPHPIASLEDLVRNINIVYGYFSDHMGKFLTITTPSIFIALCLYMLFKLRSVSDFFLIIISLICALSIYVSVMPLGIIVQERTTVVFWMACIFAVFAVKNISAGTKCVGVILAVLLATKTASIAQSSAKWYATTTKIMEQEFRSAMPYKPTEIKKVFIVVTDENAKAIFKKIKNKVPYKKYYSEGLDEPLNWLATLKYLGFKEVRLCVKGEGWECDVAPKLPALEKAPRGDNLFGSYKNGDSVVFIVNESQLN